METMKIGVIGNGFVGKATQLLKSPIVDLYVYDTVPEKCIPIGTTIDIINKCHLIFVCVPTPMKPDGSCDTSIIESVLMLLNNPFIIIRSTVPIFFTQKQNVYFMPEFLTEANWEHDFKTCERWILGLNNDVNNHQTLKQYFELLIKMGKESAVIQHDNIYYCHNTEAEMLKLLSNAYLSTKVIFFNEFYDLCSKLGINYDNVINLVKMDSRIGFTHMKVPGAFNLQGYGGTCFPKDTNNILSICHSNDICATILEANLYKNEYIYRSQHDWLSDYGRTNTKNDKKIVLVTGGAGFIGSNLVRRLLNENNIVICLDNLSSGNYCNIEELLTNPNFYFKKQDVTTKLFFPKIDQIYHLACPASPPKYQSDPVGTIKTTTLGTMNVLELAKLHKCPVLIASTSEVYGDPLQHPQQESYWGNVNPIGERSCYDEGKRIGETMAYEYKKQHGINTKIIRIFNTFGPYMDINDGRVITNYIKSYLENKPITIYGDGSQTRSFCYIDDLVDGIRLMMDSNLSGPINLGNPDNEFTMVQLADYFDSIIEIKLERQFLPLPRDDPKQRKPDISKATQLLSWSPKVCLYDGICKTIKYFKSRRL